jgi:hypothetical protein
LLASNTAMAGYYPPTWSSEGHEGGLFPDEDAHRREEFSRRLIELLN